MSQPFTPTSETWYIRTGSGISGPFSYQVLLSMKQRGRIPADTTVSHDRLVWIPVAKLGDAFVDVGPSSELVHMSSSASSLPPSMGSGSGYFVMINGVSQGPYSHYDVQQRITMGTLGASDPIWAEGYKDWVPVMMVPGFVFVDRQLKAKSWLRNQPVLLSCIGFAVCVLIIAPAWFVFRLESNAEQSRQANLDRQQHQAELLEKSRKEKQEHYYKLVDMRNAYGLQLESVNQQWATMQLAQIRDVRVQEKQRLLEQQIADVDDQIKKTQREIVNIQDLEKQQFATLQSVADEVGKISQHNSGTHYEERMLSCKRCGGDGNTSWLSYSKCSYCGGSGQHSEQVEVPN